MKTHIISNGTTISSFVASDYCVKVTIVGDYMIEQNEIFIIKFDASPDFFQGPDSIEITVLNDDDGM